MAYVFLKDGSPFNALSLTTRFDTLVTDVNAVSADAIQFLGLGPEQLPSFVGTTTQGITNTFTSENTADGVSTPSTEGSPPLINGALYLAAIPSLLVGPSGPADSYQTVGNAGFSVDTRSVGGYSLDRETDAEGITALLVMANVEVKQFDPASIEIVASRNHEDYPHRYWGITLNEYEWDATVILELEDSAGTKGYLPRTERQVSPRVTISAYNNMGDAAFPDPPEEGSLSTPSDPYLQGRNAMSPMRDLPGHTESPGSTFPPVVQQFDHRTHQDVSIRTVITKDDLTGVVDSGNNPVTLTNVKHVRFGFGSLNGRRYYVQRANITVLPLLAKVEVY